MSQPRLLPAHTALLGCLTAALLLGLAGSGGGAARAATAGVSSTLAITPLSHADVAGAGDLSRFQHVGLNPWYHHLIPQLKQKHPGIKVVVYKDMSSTRSYACRAGQDDALLPAGVGYCFADARHPDWFLTDDQGRRCEWSGYREHWQMDVGDPDYQRQWLANVLPELRAHGWDGVLIDNTMVSITDGYCPGRRFPRYPTQAAYQAATRSFLAYVGPRLQAEGFLVLPNIQAHGSLAGVDVWRDWLQFTSGGTREYWMRWGTPGSYFGGEMWLELQRIFEEVQRQGKLFATGTPLDGPDDVRSMRYGRASFLIGWNGGSAAFGGGNWHPEWTVEIGTPTGPRYQVGHAWRRDYSGGTAIANVSAAATQTVALGATYLLPDGSPVRSVTLAPLTGLVLRKQSRVPTSAGSLPTGADATTAVTVGRVSALGYKRATAPPRWPRALGPSKRAARYPRAPGFWRWIRWYTGASEYDGRARDVRVRPRVGKVVPQRWWAGLRRFVRRHES